MNFKIHLGESSFSRKRVLGLLRCPTEDGQADFGPFLPSFKQRSADLICFQNFLKNNLSKNSKNCMISFK